MSLDQNLFTLNIVQRPNAPHIVELIDPQETVHYRKERVDGPAYAFNVFDPLSESLLCTVSAPAATSKAKTIELHNPSVPVELKYSGTFTFRWSFTWEEHEFEWKREECHIIRKPDPPVLVAITKEPAGRIKSKTVQILDYNINRFDIQDRKGLEIVLLSALLSFSDYSDGFHSERQEGAPAKTNSIIPTSLSLRAPERAAEPAVMAAVPLPPPKPKKTGAEKIADMQKGELSDILVTEEGEMEDYAEYCSNLLEGDNMLFVVLRSSSPLTVPKVLQVAHQTKRIRHRAGDESELHQYVQYDTAEPKGKKGPRVIKLDSDTSKDKYKPPENLVVHLSKIPMPELQPKAKQRSADAKPAPAAEPPSNAASSSSSKAKEREDRKRREREERERKEREKRDKRERESAGKGKGKGRSSDLGPAEVHGWRAESSERAGGNRLSKRRSQSPVRGSGRVPAHQVHPSQPSPSPSQINNPSIYAAPPPPAMPPRPSPRPSPAPASAPAGSLYPAYTSAHLQPPPGGPPPHASSHPYPPDAFYRPPGAYPMPQRPVSAYGSYMGPPPPQAPAQPRPVTASSLVTGLLDKLRL